MYDLSNEKKWFNPSTYQKNILDKYKYDPKEIVGIITPHASLDNINEITINAFNYIKWDNFTEIVIISTLHNNNNKVYLPKFKKCKLQNITLNINCDKYENQNDIFKIDENNIFDKEHSWKMSMIYIFALLQKYNKLEINIIPMLIGNVNIEKVSDIIYNNHNHNILYICNSDFTHYGECYNYVINTYNIYNYIEKKDNKIMEYIIKNDYSNIIKDNINNNTICGKYSLALYTNIIKNICDIYTKKIDYVINKFNNNLCSVSYCTMVSLYNIHNINKYNILKIPRYVLCLYYTYGSNIYKFIKNRIIYNDITLHKGIFVTIYKKNSLYGCIGSLKSGNIVDLIISNTINAFNDNRFKKDSIYEYINNKNDYDIYINFLDDYYDVNDINKGKNNTIDNFYELYEPCKHGIIIEKDNKRATYLPKVMDDILKKEIENFCKLKKINNKKYREYFNRMVFEKLMEKAHINNNELSDVNIYIYDGYEFNEKNVHGYNNWINEQI
jgi:AmmeMemoRadiSam system protein B